MTNTPMTFEEWYANHDTLSEYSAQAAWEASQAQQAQTIAELKEDLLDLRTQVNYRCADVQRLTELNNELVEALEVMTPIYHQLAWIAICWNDHNFDDKAIYKKVNTAFTEAGFSRGDGVEPVNDFVEQLESLIAKVKGN